MLHIDQLSFWEKDIYFSNIDFVVLGAGIVGCSTALSLRKLHPKAKIVVLERGFLPSGASTKNAGFACFGSASELLNDIKNTSKKIVWDTVAMRWEGLQTLFSFCSKTELDYKKTGSYDLFTQKEENVYQFCCLHLDEYNDELSKITGNNQVFRAEKVPIDFGFKTIENAIFNAEEGMIDTGKMMQRFHQKLIAENIIFLSGIEVKKINDLQNEVILSTSIGELNCAKLCVATNGFATQLLPALNVVPARAQVLITKPIANLPFEGTFHYNEGYYYFRNVGNRVLFGGGRNLDFIGETTTEFETTDRIKSVLKQLLSEVILPNTTFEIDYYWAGIMGVGSDKKPIIQKVSENVAVGVRMGGMGVAIGSWVGQQLALTSK
jgi:gamma-glutamylputrescine oxidase